MLFMSIVMGLQASIRLLDREPRGGQGSWKYNFFHMHGDIIWVSLSKKTNCCRTFTAANSDGGRNNRWNQLSKHSWIYNC